MNKNFQTRIMQFSKSKSVDDKVRNISHIRQLIDLMIDSIICHETWRSTKKTCNRSWMKTITYHIKHVLY